MPNIAGEPDIAGDPGTTADSDTAEESDTTADSDTAEDPDTTAESDTAGESDATEESDTAEASDVTADPVAMRSEVTEADTIWADITLAGIMGAAITSARVGTVETIRLVWGITARATTRSLVMMAVTAALPATASPIPSNLTIGWTTTIHTPTNDLNMPYPRENATSKRESIRAPRPRFWRRW